MIIYHQISSDELDAVLQQGLKRTSRGNKGDNQDIIKTDQFLDALRPEQIRDTGLSRANNLYGYMSIGKKVVDIRDGRTISIDQLAKDSQSTTLRITVDPERCYVSDLDRYDTVKEQLMGNASAQHLTTLGNNYWTNTTKLSKCTAPPRRPEVMVTYDISPEYIQVVAK